MNDRSKPVGVGLAGCGRIARLFHTEILRDLHETQLVAFAEPDEEQRRQAQRVAPKADALRDYAELLERNDVEAVVLCLPTAMHADAAIAAFGCGKHVYVEKPLATCLDDGRRVTSAWRESGKVGAIGFNTRVHPLYREARQLVAAGRLGKLVAVRGVLASATRELPAWKRRRTSGGGALLDLASHLIDRVEFLLDDRVDDVIATIRSVRAEEDTAVLTLRLGGGVAVQLLATNSAIDEDRFEVYGDAGEVVIDRFRSRRLDLVPVAPSRRSALGTRIFHAAGRARDVLLPPAEPSFRESLRAFALAIRGEGNVAADLLDGYRNLAVVVAAEASVASGVPVRPTLVE